MPWTRKHAWTVAAAALVGLVFGCAPGADSEKESVVGRDVRRPNILLLVADDVGRSFLGPYGDAHAPTPNIDRLAREGLRFDQAFTPTALCRPSRWAIYTGLQPHASGVQGFNRVPRETSLLHDVLRDSGYQTGLLAKFGSKVQEFNPFDTFVGNKELDDGYDVEGLAREAATFFDASAERPFFLLVGFGDAHEPFPPQPYGSPDEIRVPPYLPDLPAVRDSIARYYAGIERLDRGVGLILDALEQSGRGDETLVLFTSDHGPAFPFAKSTLYDAGVHVPLIVRWPASTAPGATGALVSFVDIRPTLLEAAGVADPIAGDGHSFLPLLVGKPYTAQDALLLSHTANFTGEFPMRALRTDRYKYIANLAPEARFTARLETQAVWQAMRKAAEGDPELARWLERYATRPPEELYDLEADPGERNNRIDDPELAATLEELRRRLRTMMRATADPLAVDRPNP